MRLQRLVRFLPARRQDPGNPTLTMELREFWLAFKREPADQHHVDHIADLTNAHMCEWGIWPTRVVMNTEWYEQVCLEWSYRLYPQGQELLFPETLPIGDKLEIVLAEVPEPVVTTSARDAYYRRKSGKEKT